MDDLFGDFNEADYKPDLASAIAAEVMGLKWTHTPAGETVEDEIAASGEHCNRYGDVQEAVCKVLEEARTKPHTVSISAAPSLDLGGGEEKGASSSTTGLLPKGEAPDGSSSQATAIPSRIPAAQHPAWAFYEWLHREYDEPNPEAGEAVTWVARPLMAALTSFCMTEGPFEEDPVFAAAIPSRGWQTIETAPNADRDERVWVFGGRYTKPTLVNADGSYWRYEARAWGGNSSIPTHWYPLIVPEAPALAGEAEGQDTKGGSNLKDGGHE